MSAMSAKPRGKSTVLLIKRYENSVVTSKKGAAGGPGKKSHVIGQESAKDKDSQRNPRDASIDGAAARDLGVTTQIEAPHKRKRADSAGAQEALSTQLLPLRRDQSRAALNVHAFREPTLAGLVETTTTDPYKELIRVNEHLARARAERPHPLQDLVRLRLLSPQALPVHEKQSRAADLMARDVDFMCQQLRQIEPRTAALDGSGAAKQQPVAAVVEQPPNTLVVSRTTQRQSRLEQAQGKPVQVHLSLVFGPVNYAFGFEKRASADHREFVAGQFVRDRRAKNARFFLGDPLDETVPYRSAPCQFRWYRELREQNLARFRARHELPERSLGEIGRPDLEAVSRAHITLHYRRRPRDGEQLCARGSRCLFYTFRDPTVRYVGRAFYTERQEKAGAHSPDALCIDCLLQDWFLQVLDNIALERQMCAPINHFTVKVCEGEYGPRGMLPVKFNRLETGIVGCVPCYDEKHRRLSDCGEFVAEVGLDF